MIYCPQAECADRDQLRELQWKRLLWSVAHAYANIPAVKQKFATISLEPGDIRNWEDVQKIPFTVKDEMRENYPYGLFAAPMSDIVRLHASSGTTGKPTVVGYTANDMAVWTECCARVAAMGGVTREDIAQVTFGYGLFTGGFGMHQGLEKLGATVLPMSSGNTERQIRLMADFGSTALVSTPSYALYLAETAKNMGMTDKLKLKYGLFGGEGSTEEMRQKIQEGFGIRATENYGLSEIVGPGVSGECLELRGMHVAEDFFYCEIVDPETGIPLPEGSWGELIITTLAREGSPMLRYRTRDITKIDTTPCSCGRTSARIAKTRGRCDDMLIIRGVNVFPSQIEAVLMAFPEIGGHYEITVRREDHMDKLEVMVELADASMLDSYAALENLSGSIRAKLKSTILCDAKITLVEPATLKRFEGKARRVTDLRNS